MPASALANAVVDASTPLQRIPEKPTMLVGTCEEGATSDPIPPDSELESGFDPSRTHEARQADVIRRVLTAAGSGDDVEAADTADEAAG